MSQPARTMDPPAKPLREPLTEFHLSPEKIRSFDSDGFLVLRGRVGGRLLERLQSAGNAWIEQAKAFGDGTGESKYPNLAHTDYAFAKRDDDRKLPYRVNYLHDKLEPASLEAIGSPEILGIAESLCGANFVPTYESMVFKMPGDGELIHWHQDAVFRERKYRIFNIDIYLDKAGPSTGALRVVPKSQTGVHDVCGMNDGSYDWDNGPHKVVNMEPGDVLVHDDMVLHGSPRTLNAPLRRVIYFEFRPVEQIIEEGPWDKSFIDQRLRLLPLALDRYREACPDRPQFDWNCAPEFRPATPSDEAAELRILHVGHTPGTYCSANSK